MIITYILCTIINVSYISAQLPASDTPYLAGASDWYIQKSAKMDISDGDITYDTDDGDIIMVLAFMPAVNLIYMALCIYALCSQNSGGTRWARRIKEWQMLNRLKLS